MSLYIVSDAENPKAKKRLVKSPSAERAIRHVVGSRFEADLVRRAEDAADLMASGMVLETAGEEPEPETKPETKGDDTPPPASSSKAGEDKAKS